MAKGKVSGKTHTQTQLNDWANQNNPNNKAYRANADNHANQMNRSIKRINRYTIHSGVIPNRGLTGHRTTPIMTIDP